MELLKLIQLLSEAPGESISPEATLQALKAAESAIKILFYAICALFAICLALDGMFAYYINKFDKRIKVIEKKTKKLLKVYGELTEKSAV